MNGTTLIPVCMHMHQTETTNNHNIKPSRSAPAMIADANPTYQVLDSPVPSQNTSLFDKDPGGPTQSSPLPLIPPPPSFG